MDHCLAKTTARSAGFCRNLRAYTHARSSLCPRGNRFLGARLALEFSQRSLPSVIRSIFLAPRGRSPPATRSRSIASFLCFSICRCLFSCSHSLFRGELRGGLSMHGVINKADVSMDANLSREDIVGRFLQAGYKGVGSTLLPPPPPPPTPSWTQSAPTLRMEYPMK